MSMTAMVSTPVDPEISTQLLKYLTIAATATGNRSLPQVFEQASQSQGISREDAVVEAMQLYVAAHSPQPAE